jgi:apolipoprotein N-acyltransferase
MNKNRDFLAVCKSYLPFCLSGLLLFLSFPDINLYFLAWFALAPALVSLYDKDMRFAFKAGLLLGMVYFFGTTYWIYHALHVYGSMPLSLSVFLVVLLSLYLSLYTALFCLLYNVVLRKTLLPSLLTAPCIWTSLEFLRSYALTGFPWSSLGYSQYEFLPIIQIADITGIYGISFLVVALNGIVADVFITSKIRADKPLYSSISFLGGAICLIVVLILVVSYGFFRLYQERGGAAFKAAIIQGNIEQDKKWDLAYQKAVLQTYMELTSRAAEKAPDIIIWPETALPFVFREDKSLTEDLITFHKGLDSYMLFGSILIKENKQTKSGAAGKNRLSNSALLLDKNSNVSYIYDKIHLVPFGEYVPLRNILFFIDKLVYGGGDYYPGDRYLSAVTPFGDFATLICYEIIFPGMVRKFYIQGGDFMVTITNDAWFGDTHGPYQHFSMAVFRAIENRKPVLRAANSGISGFIDSNGRIMGASKLFERTYLIKEVRKDKTMTFYTKYGDIFSYLCIVVTVTIFLSYRKL